MGSATKVPPVDLAGWLSDEPPCFRYEYGVMGAATGGDPPGCIVWENDRDGAADVSEAPIVRQVHGVGLAMLRRQFRAVGILIESSDVVGQAPPETARLAAREPLPLWNFVNGIAKRWLDPLDPVEMAARVCSIARPMSDLVQAGRQHHHALGFSGGGGLNWNTAGHGLMLPAISWKERQALVDVIYGVVAAAGVTVTECFAAVVSAPPPSPEDLRRGTPMAPFPPLACAEREWSESTWVSLLSACSAFNRVDVFRAVAAMDDGAGLQVVRAAILKHRAFNDPFLFKAAISGAWEVYDYLVAEHGASAFDRNLYNKRIPLGFAAAAGRRNEVVRALGAVDAETIGTVHSRRTWVSGTLHVEFVLCV